MKTKALLLTVFLLICSITMAEMTVFLKDGTSVNVTKIVFRGNVADLFLLNGSTRSVPSDKIDLKASGIPKAEGSYGQAGLSPNVRQKRTGTPPLIGDPKQRQMALKEEWDKAEQSAVALKTIGAIRQGDVVRIANRSASESTPTTSYGYFEGIEEGSFEEGKFTENRDDPYLVIYKSADGIYGKKLFDAPTFHSNFSINEKSNERPPPIIVPNKAPQIETTSPPIEVPVKTEPPPSLEPTVKEETNTTRDQQEIAQTKVSTRSFPVVPIIIGIGGIVLAGGALFVYSRNRKKPFINVSRFKQYENELHDFELEIWLKHGRTMDQLVEICLKKFYQEQPAALAAAIKIQKGADRSTIIQSIARQSGQDIGTAEDVYSEMFQRINWIRETIRQIAEKIGKQPLAQTELHTVSAERTNVPSLAPPAPQTIPTKSAATLRPKPSPQVEPAVKSPQVSASGLPVYLRNVLKQLGELSD